MSHIIYILDKALVLKKKVQVGTGRSAAIHWVNIPELWSSEVALEGAPKKHFMDTQVKIV